MLHQALRENPAIQAAVRLLTDDDERVVRMCRRRILAWGGLAQRELETAALDPDPRLRVRARAALRSIELDVWVRSFADEVAKARETGGGPAVLESGMRKLVGFSGLGDGDLVAFDAALDELAEQLRAVTSGRTSRTAARHISHVLGVRLALRGSRRMPKDRRAWLPDRVLESRRGPAAVIAGLYLLIGRRAGLQLSGVLLPEFVVVRVHGRRRRVLVDPYHEGRTVTRHDCLRYLRRMERFGAGSAHRSLVDVDDADVLDRILEDLILLHDRPEHGEVRDALRAARASLEPALGRRFG
ncbi:MAG: transglutaminase family protein [Planctomycetota bacterium]